MPLITPFQNWRVRTKLIFATIPLIAIVTMTAAWVIHLREAADLEAKLKQRALSLSTQIMADRKYYTSVIIPRAIELGGSLGNDYQHVPGQFPLPATFVREVSALTAIARQGYTASLISPWPINKDKGAKDQFQREAFTYLLENPVGIYYRSDTIAGMPVMRFITADRVSVQSCADCHNAHPRSPKHDFKLNDVMGGLEIIIPTDEYLKQDRRDIALMLAASGGFSLLVMGIVAWGARQAILLPLAKLTERLKKNLRAEDGRLYMVGPAEYAGSNNEMARFERACMEMQALLAKQDRQLRLAAKPIEEGAEDHIAALLEAEERLQRVVDHGKDAIFYLDKLGVVRWANRRAIELTARLMTDLVGHPFMTVLSPQSATLAKARLAAVQRGETVPPAVEFEVVRPTGGSVRIEATAASVQENGKLVGRLLVARELIRPASSAPE